MGGAKEKVRSPSGEKAPEAAKVEEPAKPEETPAPAPVVAPVEPVAAEAPKEEKKEEEPATGVTGTASATPTHKDKAKRGSIFGNLTGSVKEKKEGDSEKPQGLMGLFRNASKAGKSKKEKEATAAPAKVEETAEPKEEKTEEPATTLKEADPVAPAGTESAAIGDVVPDAVTVGQAPKSTPQVSTTA